MAAASLGIMPASESWPHTYVQGGEVVQQEQHGCCVLPHWLASGGTLTPESAASLPITDNWSYLTEAPLNGLQWLQVYPRAPFWDTCCSLSMSATSPTSYPHLLASLQMTAQSTARSQPTRTVLLSRKISPGSPGGVRGGSSP